jgi:hypothetical protein
MKRDWIGDSEGKKEKVEAPRTHDADLPVSEPQIPAEAAPVEDESVGGAQVPRRRQRPTTKSNRRGNTNIITKIDEYLRRYVAFPSDVYPLALALWTAGTHVYETFDAFGYLVITAATKRAGKTRLMELLSFLGARARHVADITPAALFAMIEEERPTLLIDEAERFATSQRIFEPLSIPAIDVAEA